MEEVLHQQRDVFLSLSERRKMNGNDAQAVEEIIAEGPFGHGVGQVFIRRRQDADVQLDRSGASDMCHFALLDDAQQLGLNVQADVADLIEKDRSASIIRI
jgi:hypothetical protein